VVKKYRVSLSESQRLLLLSKQCLDRRIPDRNTLSREVAAWEAARNGLGASVNWRFTTGDARIKLRHLYPTYEAGSA
jgi:hypothetical protein